MRLISYWNIFDFERSIFEKIKISYFLHTKMCTFEVLFQNLTHFRYSAVLPTPLGVFRIALKRPWYRWHDRWRPLTKCHFDQNSNLECSQNWSKNEKKVLDPMQARTWGLWSAKPKLYHWASNLIHINCNVLYKHLCLSETSVLRNLLLLLWLLKCQKLRIQFSFKWLVQINFSLLIWTLFTLKKH
jgi:hypothetical protein